MERSPVKTCTEKLFKVLVIGDVKVGKSNIILRYVKKRFDENYKGTIGIDFTLKTLEWDAKTTVRLQLWDIAGQDRFCNMSRVFCKAAMGALVVLDITNSLTLQSAARWKQDLDSKVCLDDGRPVPAILLANKCDLKERDKDLVSSLDRFCKDNNFVGWFETSAKEDININEACEFLVKQMMLRDTGLSNEEHHWDRIKVDQTPGKSQSSQSRCCSKPAN
ncbi:ras-related protein Rab-32 [Stegastes partitus]|uniref:Ras-related protein Rab n=1 Tax=Stegastes partitus TaxID=144197 RepID=A0A3B5BHT9_9TELE|nr:PREDICTED: ras-related protein Rab-32-like [Stegastes partitus]